MASTKLSKKRKRVTGSKTESCETEYNDACAAQKCVKVNTTVKTFGKRSSLGHFPFLRLPAEIRNLIYRFCLVPRARCLPDLYGQSEPTSVLQFAPSQDRAGLCLSLLRTNKQAHHEAADIFYKENIIFVRLYDVDDKFLQWKKKQPLKNLGRVHRSGRVTKEPSRDVDNGSLYKDVFVNFRRFQFAMWYCCGWETRLADLGSQIGDAVRFVDVLARKISEPCHTGLGNCAEEQGPDIKSLHIDMRMHCHHPHRHDALAEIIKLSLMTFDGLRCVGEVQVTVRRIAQGIDQTFTIPGLKECIEEFQCKVQEPRSIGTKIDHDVAEEPCDGCPGASNRVVVPRRIKVDLCNL